MVDLLKNDRKHKINGTKGEDLYVNFRFILDQQLLQRDYSVIENKPKQRLVIG